MVSKVVRVRCHIALADFGTAVRNEHATSNHPLNERHKGNELRVVERTRRVVKRRMSKIEPGERQASALSESTGAPTERTELHTAAQFVPVPDHTYE
eukprot:3548631-Amphidinium_carterae.2